MGAGNSAVVVDLPLCGPMPSPRVPNLVPIPGPRKERETPGQRPRPNYGHPHRCQGALRAVGRLSHSFSLNTTPWATLVQSALIGIDEADNSQLTP